MLNTLNKFYRIPIRLFGFKKRIKALTGFFPVETSLYKCALTHKSHKDPVTGDYSKNNERLEYLGDAILSAAIADYLYNIYPDASEGFMTKMRAKLVNRENLNRIAVNMGISRLVMLDEKTTLTKKNIYGNALEALIGAMYLDRGFGKTGKFIVDNIIKFHPDIERLAYEDSDFKSQIIHWAQKNRQEVCFESHEIIEQDNSGTAFVATIHIMDKLAGKGSGATKKEAQQHAARQALRNLSSLPFMNTG